jgi:hypothetical protein
MPSQHGRSRKFKHLINPDGTIRVVTKGQITPIEADTVVEDDVRRLPHIWTWDFAQVKFVLIPASAKAARQAEGLARSQASRATRTGLVTKLQSLDANTRDCMLDLASLLGVDLTR